jgi:hypothetical protein
MLHDLRDMDLRVRTLAALLLATGMPHVGHGSSAAGDLAAASLKACQQGRSAGGRAERQALFTRGQILAEQAVAVDERSPEAHFALFCNLGEMLRLDGERLSSVFQFRRLMKELDRTLALDPGHTDALAAKGILLVRLPRLLGGNMQKGEEILHRVIDMDPAAVSSRLALARLKGARGERDAGLMLAATAFQEARAQGRLEDVTEAETVLAALAAGSPLRTR